MTSANSERRTASATFDKFAEFFVQQFTASLNSAFTALIFGGICRIRSVF